MCSGTAFEPAGCARACNPIAIGAMPPMIMDLYGGLMGWPFEKTGPLRLILVLFLLVQGARPSCSLSSTDVSSPGAKSGCRQAVSSTLSWRASLFSIF